MIDRACISLGEKCNLKCSYCHFHNEENGKLNGEPQEFSVRDLIEIIAEIKSYTVINKIPTFKIGIVGSGEPLLQFRKIKQLIDYIKEKNITGLAFYTITNGTILNRNILDFFQKNKDLIKLCFSLDGYEELHNLGREKFKEVYNGIEAYEDVFGRKPPINCTVHKETINNRKKLHKFLKSENFKDVTFSRLFDSHDEKMTINATEFSELLHEFNDTQFEVRQLDENNKKKYDCTMYGTLCGVGKTNIFITRQGIYPCGRFYGKSEYNYGAFNMSLTDLECEMSKMKLLVDGECYFDKYTASNDDIQFINLLG